LKKDLQWGSHLWYLIKVAENKGRNKWLRNGRASLIGEANCPLKTELRVSSAKLFGASTISKSASFNEQINSTIMESLILAQDERWRRA
jgi:hypothetical protein